MKGLIVCLSVNSDREREKGERKASTGTQDELNVIGAFKQTVQTGLFGCDSMSSLLSTAQTPQPKEQRATKSLQIPLIIMSRLSLNNENDRFILNLSCLKRCMCCILNTMRV